MIIFLKIIGLGILGVGLLAGFLYIMCWMITEREDLFIAVTSLAVVVGLILFIGSMVAMCFPGLI